LSEKEAFLLQRSIVSAPNAILQIFPVQLMCAAFRPKLTENNINQQQY